MTEITASLVKELRERSGAGMMECKKALTENGGNTDAAIEWLRKQGLAKADKKASRVAAEGRIVLAQDGGKAVLVEVNSETDFVAKDENFLAFADMRRLREEAEQAGKGELFEQLREFLTERPDEADYARAAAALNLRRNTLAVAVHRMRHRLRELVRQELAQTTACKDDLDAELRELRATLSGVV